MSKKLRKILNNKMFVFILGGLLFSVASVYAITYFPSHQVTYDNSTSKLNSNNVQGAIDELYNECSSATSLGNYVFYGVNQYHTGSIHTPYEGTIYRCNSDGSGCISVYSQGDVAIGGIFATNEYLYYSTNQYYGNDAELPYKGTVYKCNLDGSGCTIFDNTSDREFVF